MDVWIEDSKLGSGMEGCDTKAAGLGARVNANGVGSLEGMRFHFIGAGGIGMSGLAKILIRNKAIVRGSDEMGSEVVDRLCELGADIRIGHKEENVGEDAEAVVISAAIRDDNPEFMAARANGVKIYKYAEMLGVMMDYYEGIAIAGTHGKSTTSGWLTYCLKQAGHDPSFIIGGDIPQLGSSSGVGEGKYFVAEACEYDRSFLNLKPRLACVLNIEQDHLDYYKGEDEIVEAFGEFACGAKADGVVIANGQDGNVAKVIARLGDGQRCRTFGLDEGCDFRAENIELADGLYSFDVYHGGELVGSTRISLPGRHNILNALAVTAMWVSLGLPGEQVLGLLGDFTGVDRRLMLKGEVGGIMVLDDYAHHPTEIRASLEAMRERYRPGRIWCIFQPHQYSRTRFLLDDFAKSFQFADVTIVPEIYFVRDSEASKEEVNAKILVERIRERSGEAVFVDGFGAICDYLKENVSGGDLVVTMGAGDIWKVADEYIQWLRKNS